MIKVNIRHEMHQYFAKPEEKKVLEELINSQLEPIMLDCIAFNASVDAVKIDSGNYKIVPKCDQYSTLMQMHSLLPEVIPSF